MDPNPYINKPITVTLPAALYHSLVMAGTANKMSITSVVAMALAQQGHPFFLSDYHRTQLQAIKELPMPRNSGLTCRISIRVSNPMRKSLDRASKASHLSISQIVNYALRSAGHPLHGNLTLFKDTSENAQ